MVLLAAGLAVLAIAVPEFVTASAAGSAGHSARHLATWQAGFGVGLVFAASRSRLGQALLVLVLSVATLTVAATVIDVAAGHRGPLAEAPHLVELVAVGLLWWLAPPHLRPIHRRRTDRSYGSARAGLVDAVPVGDESSGR